MPKYKILKDFVLNGVHLNEGSVVELSNTHANLKSIKDNIEKAPEDMPLTGAAASLGGIKPGVPLTEEQKKKLAEENAKLSAEANKQASEQMTRDRIEGRGEPVVKNVAESLKDKLQHEEFRTKENEPTGAENQPGSSGQAA